MQRKLKTILSTRTVIASMALAITATAFSQPYPTRLLNHEQQITKIIEGMTLDEVTALALSAVPAEWKAPPTPRRIVV